MSDDTWHQARDHFDDSSLAALVQVIAVINAFNRINIATERSADEYAAYRATAGAYLPRVARLSRASSPGKRSERPR